MPSSASVCAKCVLCRGQASDVAATSPEGINLDVIGYDLTNAPSGPVTDDFNNDGHPDYLLYYAGNRRTVVWYMNNNIHFASNNGPTLVSGWSLVAVADFNGDGHPDYLLFKPSTGQSVIWYLSGVTRTGSRSGPTIPAGYEIVGAADFDSNGRPDYVLYNSSTQQTAIWYLN